MRRHRLLSPALAAALLMLACTACGQDLVTGTYEGPLAVEGRQGAAHQVVECDGTAEGGNGYPDEHDDGALSDDAEEALRTAFDERQLDGVRDGYRVVRADGPRTLFTFTADGRVRQAVIARDGEASGEKGWYVESWARCDYAELPEDVAEAAGVQVWSDATGRVSTRRITSYAGAEHCAWEHMTFLKLGKAEYVREPDASLADFFAGPYASSVALPPDARDTGFRRGSDHLWLSADGAWAYVGSGERVERWPRVVERLGCV
ncbi:hypothetical protein KV100_10900 [Mumia sp. zg.B21]|uniref:hypothetical protein n=1 Tax=Mumia sp. zg.B21 TaxID=2855447 RepID=UPI001C6F2DB2|nr:hypothetical protein [Mumia sp. zg.B21]MBW9210167.1 hypothetical protein [Mumia sp. zg.B21]